MTKGHGPNEIGSISIKGVQGSYMMLPRNPKSTGFRWNRAIIAAVCVMLAGFHRSALLADVLPAYVASGDQYLHLAVGDDVAACVWGDGRVSSFRLADGRQLATFSLGTQTEVQRICLGAGPNSPLALFLQSAVDATLSTYDPRSGKRLFHAEPPEGAFSDSLLGISSDGRKLFWDSGQSLFALDATTGKSIWSVRYRPVTATGRSSGFGHFWNWLKIASDGSSFTMLLDDRIVCEDLNGRQLWKLNRGSLTGVGQQQAVGDTLLLYDRDQQQFVLVSLVNGAIIARVSGTENGLRAAAPDGTSLVFAGPSKARLFRYKSNSWLDLDTGSDGEFHFCAGSRFLSVADPLKAGSVDRAHNTITVSRASNTIRLFDAYTGKLDHVISLSLDGK